MGVNYSSILPDNEKASERLVKRALVSRKDLYALKEELRKTQLSEMGIDLEHFMEAAYAIGLDDEDTFVRQLFAQFDDHQQDWIDAKQFAIYAAMCSPRSRGAIVKSLWQVFDREGTHFLSRKQLVQLATACLECWKRMAAALPGQTLSKAKAKAAARKPFAVTGKEKKKVAALVDGLLDDLNLVGGKLCYHELLDNCEDDDVEDFLDTCEALVDLLPEAIPGHYWEEESENAELLASLNRSARNRHTVDRAKCKVRPDYRNVIIDYGPLSKDQVRKARRRSTRDASSSSSDPDASYAASTAPEIDDTDAADHSAPPASSKRRRRRKKKKKGGSATADGGASSADTEARTVGRSGRVRRSHSKNKHKSRKHRSRKHRSRSRKHKRQGGVAHTGYGAGGVTTDVSGNHISDSGTASRRRRRSKKSKKRKHRHSKKKHKKRRHRSSGAGAASASATTDAGAITDADAVTEVTVDDNTEFDAAEPSTKRSRKKVKRTHKTKKRVGSKKRKKRRKKSTKDAAETGASETEATTTKKRRRKRKKTASASEAPADTETTATTKRRRKKKKTHKKKKVVTTQTTTTTTSSDPKKKKRRKKKSSKPKEDEPKVIGEKKTKVGTKKIVLGADGKPKMRIKRSELRKLRGEEYYQKRRAERKKREREERLKQRELQKERMSKK